MVNIDNILLDYYDGAYGPTIRIDTHSIGALYRLKQLFLEISKSDGHQINITDIDNVKIYGLTQLVLKNNPNTKKTTKRLSRKGNDITGTIFILEMPSEEWRTSAGLIDGMIVYAKPGHQYLSQEGIDDALLELAFMESTK